MSDPLLKTWQSLCASGALASAKRRIVELEAENKRLREALNSIAANTCCDPCQEAKRVAQAALAGAQEEG